jgi:hypothetical protein
MLLGQPQWTGHIAEKARPSTLGSASTCNSILLVAVICHFAGDVRVFEGHAFIVEAAVSVGGREMRPGINVYRFANRIPLLFEAGNDVITKTAMKRINWGAYKMNQSSDKVCWSPAWGCVAASRFPAMLNIDAHCQIIIQ